MESKALPATRYLSPIYYSIPSLNTSSNIIKRARTGSVYTPLVLPSQRNQRTPLKPFIFNSDNLLEDLSQSKLFE